MDSDWDIELLRKCEIGLERWIVDTKATILRSNLSEDRHLAVSYQTTQLLRCVIVFIEVDGRDNPPRGCGPPRSHTIQPPRCNRPDVVQFETRQTFLHEKLIRGRSWQSFRARRYTIEGYGRLRV